MGKETEVRAVFVSSAIITTRNQYRIHWQVVGTDDRIYLIRSKPDADIQPSQFLTIKNTKKSGRKWLLISNGQT